MIETAVTQIKFIDELINFNIIILKVGLRWLLMMYSVTHNSIAPWGSKELCSKIALGEVGMSLP